MKRVFILILLCLVTVSIFSQSADLTKNKVDLLITDGLTANFATISDFSLELTSLERQQLYEAHNKDLFAPLLLNAFVGFGSGSFIQEDTVGGTIGLSLDVVGAVELVSAYTLVLLSFYAPADDAMLNRLETSYWLGIAGGITLASSRIFQITRPILFRESYNKKLKKSLQMSNVTYNILPQIDNQGNIGITTLLAIKL